MKWTIITVSSFRCTLNRPYPRSHPGPASLCPAPEGVLLWSVIRGNKLQRGARAYRVVTFK